MKKVCIFSTGRSDYDLIKNLAISIKKEKKFKLQLIITGSHVSKRFGNQWKTIKDDKLNIYKKFKSIYYTKQELNPALSMSAVIKNLSRIFRNNKPDIIFLLGDRHEVMAAASTALIFNIPIAHIHGGEITEGAYDNSIRHAISKIANIHFVATKLSKKRIIQMGESPKNIFLTGGLATEIIQKTKLLNKKNLKELLKISFKNNNFLVTIHPTTLENSKIKIQMSELFKALDFFKDTNIFFTYPNADFGSSYMIKEIKKYILKRKGAKLFKYLGSKKYFSLIKNVDLVIGNSSSGILEAPLLKTFSINIGNRQKGREKAKSIIDCKNDKRSIVKAIKNTLCNKKRYNKKVYFSSPYKIKKNPSLYILKILKKIQLRNIVKKKFRIINY